MPRIPRSDCHISWQCKVKLQTQWVPDYACLWQWRQSWELMVLTAVKVEVKTSGKLIEHMIAESVKPDACSHRSIVKEDSADSEPKPNIVDEWGALALVECFFIGKGHADKILVHVRNLLSLGLFSKKQQNKVMDFSKWEPIVPVSFCSCYMCRSYARHLFKINLILGFFRYPWTSH